MYLFKQVKRNVRGHFTKGTWRQPPSSSVSRTIPHWAPRAHWCWVRAGKPIQKTHANEGKKRQTLYSGFPLSPNTSWAEAACPAPAGRGPWKNLAHNRLLSSHSSHGALLGSGMWGQILEKVSSSWLSQGRKSFSRSGRKLLSRSIRKQHSIPRTGLCIQQEQSRAEQGLLHPCQEEISYEHMDKAFWCFPPATGDMGGHLPSASAGPRATKLLLCTAW